MMKPAVPAAAIGNPNAAEVATALWIRTLHAVMKGTEMKAPPAPTMLEMIPIPLPTPNKPSEPGRLRVSLGFGSSNICAAATPANTPNAAESADEDMSATICGPTSEPSRMPGASPRTTRHRTAPRRWCARMLEIDVKPIVAIDVATAMCIRCSGGKCSRVKTIVSTGMIVIAPPTPSSPARKPTTAERDENRDRRPVQVRAA